MTQGFYKLDPSGILLYAPNFVINKDYEMFKEQKDEYEYPIDGWHWFENEKSARSAFGLPSLEELEQQRLYQEFLDSRE